jgi:hypothetical protein
VPLPIRVLVKLQPHSSLYKPFFGFFITKCNWVNFAAIVIKLPCPGLNDEVLEFSGGFAGLHTKTYEEILKGNGVRLAETRAVIELVQEIRVTK